MSHLELLKSATKYMYFNIDRKHFENTKIKEQIKNLFEKNWFNETIIQEEVLSDNDLYKLNNYICKIRKNKDLFNRLFHYPLKRTGNAEVMLYLLIKNSHLSVSSTSGRDIIINNENYEIKNCIVSKKYNSQEKYYSNFKLGNSFSLRELINLVEDYFGFIPKGSELNEARKTTEFLQIETTYRNIVYSNYFSKHKIIFIDKEGIIQFVGFVKKEDIFIDTITEGTIKPMIRISI